MCIKITISCFRQQGQESVTEDCSGIGNNSCSSAAEKSDFNGISENASESKYVFSGTKVAGLLCVFQDSRGRCKTKG